MKRVIIAIMSLACMVSCVVSSPIDEKPMNETNINKFCNDLMEKDIQQNLIHFYNAYYISKFYQLDPEEQVADKYNILRTSVKRNVDYSYLYKNVTYAFNNSHPFTEGSTCEVRTNWWSENDAVIKMLSNMEWEIASSAGAEIHVLLISANDEEMTMQISVEGKRTEKSQFSAKYSAENMMVRITHKNPIVIDKIAYEGVLKVDFYENTTLIKQHVKYMD